jgi:hypothetical protein
MKRSAAKLAAAQNIWDVYRSIYARRGVDVAGRCANWARQKRNSLEKYSAGNIFDKLCGDGCKALPLAFLIAIVQPLRSFEKKWKQITGTGRQREQKIRAIEKTADVLEDLLSSLAEVLITGSHLSTDAGRLKEVRQELISPSENLLTWGTTPYVSDPAIVIHTLRTYASLLQTFESSQKSTAVASSDMFAKYLFSAYVYRATGRFHDEEVSALIGAALSVTYDETAHRVWRSRNYKRIDKSISSIAEMLTDFGTVSST